MKIEKEKQTSEAAPLKDMKTVNIEGVIILI